jgi:hypothetical protein
MKESPDVSLERAAEPFVFNTHITLTELTGRRARDLKELLEQLRTVPPSVIYYHTHHFLEQHYFLSPEPPNDFAYWVTHAIKEPELGEQLASVDTIQFHTIADLRQALVMTVESHLAAQPRLHRAPDGEELHFMSSRSIVLKTPYVAYTLEEFAQALQKISIHCLYHHVFEARLRLERGNDFALWLEASLGEKELARKITHMDPYTQTVDGLRKRILQLIERRLREKQHVPA